MAAGNLDDFLEDPNRLIMARKPCDEAKRAFGLNRPVHAVEGLVAVTTQSKSLVNLRCIVDRNGAAPARNQTSPHRLKRYAKILTITQQRRGAKTVGLSTSTQRKAPMKRSMILAAIFSLATVVSAATPATACWRCDTGQRGHCGWGLFCGCGQGK